MANLQKVALVGRVNVGKSTLFNRFLSEKKAITSHVAGTTRDRNYGICSWGGVDFELIDTGGFNEEENFIDKEISKQISLGVAEADLIIFVADGKTGIMPGDQEILKTLKKLKKPIILAVNKIDNNRLRFNLPDFYRLNVGEPYPVSAANGVGSGDLLDAVMATLKKNKKPRSGKKIKHEEAKIKVAIIGQPNVGKSSLINSLLGQNRMIVSDVPHTTRDAQDIELNYHEQKITFIDTAGIRRQSHKSKDGFETESIKQSFSSLTRADIALFVTDVNQKVSFQDKKLADEIVKSNVGVIIIANKWDLVPEKDTETAQKYTEYYYGNYPFLKWAPILYISATDKTNLNKILPLVVEIYHEKFKKIEDNPLSKFLKNIIKKHKPARGRGVNHPYIHTLKQVGVNPPTFEVKMNFKAYLHFSYLRFIENNLRYKFGFKGVPMKIYVAKSQNKQDIN